MIKEITSAANPVVKNLRILATSKKARQESGTFILEGWRGVKTLFEHASGQYRIVQLVIAESWTDLDVLPGSIETFRVPDHVFEKISEVRNAQGILGVIRQSPSLFAFNPDSGNYLLLDNLRDPGNLGTLIRSSVGAGFDGVLLFGDCVEPFNPKVIRSTMGTFAFCNIWSVGKDEIADLLKYGYDLYTTSGAEGQSLYETSFGKKSILVIGSEANGVSDALMKLAGKKITIPLSKECESLNAAIAGSICMFHLRNV